MYSDEILLFYDLFIKSLIQNSYEVSVLWLFSLNDRLLSFLCPVLSGPGRWWLGCRVCVGSSAHLSPKSEFQRGLGPHLEVELGSGVQTVG